MITDEDTRQSEGVVIPIRIAPWLYAEFLDVAGVPMHNRNLVAVLTATHDGYTDEWSLSLAYRYLTDDTETEESDGA